MKYNIVYADPPWDGLGYNNGSGKRAPSRHYPVQSLEWIQALPVGNITGNPCALFLWVTFPNLPAGLTVMERWGFHYSTCAFAWAKRNTKSDTFFMGCGNYTRANVEVCLLGTKGVGLQKMVQTHTVRQLCTARVEHHSKKPDEIRDRIVELFGDVPRVELFARDRCEGWDAWGNEVEGGITL